MKKSSSIGLVFLIGVVFFAVVVIAAGSVAAQSPVAVSTYHYDNLRTGWNNQETTLTRTNVNSTTFGIIGAVTLDEQVDAQPLIVPNQTIAGGTHDVVYVVTAKNTIYAIDASNGAILLSRNDLGSPVPGPLHCFNSGPNVGITGTPVIDLVAKTLYVIAYVNGTPPTYQLHALDLGTLGPKPGSGSPVKVTATHKLTDNTIFTFDATFQRQRPALLLQNGNVYAAFGSFCDFRSDKSRGWVLGWNANTLAPLAANQLDDTQVPCPGPSPCSSFFLSSIWMSGYGIAGDGTDLFFSTGNSDPSKSTYDGKTNIQESVVRLSGDLTPPIRGIFTPSNVASLDKFDTDLGSGGVLLLPPLSSPLAVMSGKDGNLLLLSRPTTGGLNLLNTNKQQNIGCWCGPSIFKGADGVSRVVTSQGNILRSWHVFLSPSPHLTLTGTSSVTTGQDSGFFTVVSSKSSDGTPYGKPTPGTDIIWAVGRPTGSPPTVVLQAFAAVPANGTFKRLFSSPAGSWPNTGGNANTVPVVANGKVYVASNKQLTIFGILPPHAPLIKLQEFPIASPSSPHVISGTLLAVDGSTLTLQTRTGKTTIDDTQAVQNEQVGTPLIVGVPLTALGSSFTASGALQATSIYRAKGASSEVWPPDL
jgi:hypothetical protein